jgi:hypothetical protein
MKVITKKTAGSDQKSKTFLVLTKSDYFDIRRKVRKTAQWDNEFNDGSGIDFYSEESDEPTAVDTYLDKLLALQDAIKNQETIDDEYASMLSEEIEEAFNQPARSLIGRTLVGTIGETLKSLLIQKMKSARQSLID